MVYRGHVENGAVCLEDSPYVPGSAEVEVRFSRNHSGREKRNSSLYERLKDFVGMAEGLPPDHRLTTTTTFTGYPNADECRICRHFVLFRVT